MTRHSRRWICALAFALFVALPIEVFAQKIALLSAGPLDRAQDVKAKLIAAGIADVTILDVTDLGVLPLPPTPTLPELLQYDAILTWSDPGGIYASPGPLGDVLADYVDTGRGVVQAALSFRTNVGQRLDGRWRADAYEPLSFSSRRTIHSLTLVKRQPLHPILENVNTLSIGSSTFYGTATPQGCASIVAEWSNGQPLAVTRRGPNGGRIVGLNVLPPSSDAVSTWWVNTTDGGMLMANALRFAAVLTPVPTGPKVALLASDEAPWVEDVRCKLQDLQLFSKIDTINVGTSTPVLAALLNYHSVLAWSNHALNSPSGLGNALADFVDQNGGVVQSIFSFDADDATRSIAGRWNSGYRPFTAGSLAMAPNLTLVPDDPAHAILEGVSSFDGGLASFHAAPVTLDAASTLVASWSDGQPLVATGAGPFGGRIVGLNLFPPSSDARGDAWKRASDGAQLIANALLYAANFNHPPSADAGADQSAQATSPAGVSFSLSGTGNDPDGDTLTYSWSGYWSGSGQNVVVNFPPPAAPNKTQTFTLVLTVADGRGGEATDSVDLTVTDITAPVLSGAPSGIVSAEATGPAGADVSYGPVTAIDAVDGSRPVGCLPAAPFPVGDTTVMCSSSDSRGNTTSHSFTVRVTRAATSAPGWMRGTGFVLDEGLRHEFAFTVRETPAGTEWARLFAKFKERRGPRGRSGGTFITSSVDAVTFDGPVVVFSGAGRWNGAAGFRYELRAADQGEPGRHRDRLRMTITAPGGSVVAHVDSVIDGGNIQRMRGGSRQ